MREFVFECVFVNVCVCVSECVFEFVCVCVGGGEDYGIALLILSVFS